MQETLDFQDQLEADPTKKTMKTLNQLYVRLVKCSMIAMRKQDKIRSHIQIALVGLDIIRICQIEEVILHYFETVLLEILEGK